MKLNFGPITVDAIVDSLTPGIKQAQLRQVVTEEYDAVQSSNSLSDSLFENSEIKAGGDSYEKIRMFWQKVSENTTVKDVEARIAKFPKAKLRRYLSHSVIMTNNQINVLNNGLRGDAFTEFCEKNNLTSTSWDDECQTVFHSLIQESQLVRDKNEEIVLYKGKKQYKVIGLSLEGLDDVDLRKPEVVNAESIQLTKEDAVAETVTAK